MRNELLVDTNDVQDTNKSETINTRTVPLQMR